MRDAFVGWVKTLVRGNGDGHAESQSSSECERSTTAVLYTYPDGETTYISEDLQSCPECGQRVVSIPNERELGLT